MSLEQIIILASCIALALFLLTPFLAQKPWILRCWPRKFEIEIPIKNQHRTLGYRHVFRFYCNDCYIQCRAYIMAYGLIFYFAMLGLIDDLFDIHGVKRSFYFSQVSVFILLSLIFRKV